MRFQSTVILLSLVLCLEAPSITRADSLTILITGGLRGRINGCDCPSAKRGGIARRAALMQQLFSQKQPLGLDCGQMLDLDPAGGAKRSACAILALSRLGTAVSLVATRDLYYGVEFISEIADSADVKLTCANIIGSETNQVIFPVWVELVQNERHLAVVGLTQHFPHRRIPGMGSWMTIPPDSAVTQIRETIPPGADLIILLTDMSERELIDLIPALPEIDIVFTSGRRVYTFSPFEINSALIVRPQPDGSNLEGITIQLDEENIATSSFFSHPLNRLIRSDIEFEKWLEDCQKSKITLK